MNETLSFAAIKGQFSFLNHMPTMLVSSAPFRFFPNLDLL